MKKPSIRNGQYLRFALGYLLVIAILCTGFTMYAFFSYRTAMREEVTESGLNRLSRLCDQHERCLDAIMSAATQMSLAFKSIKFEETPLKAYELQQQIVPYIVTNDFCDQFFLFFRDDEMLYTSYSTMKLDLFLSTLVSYESLPSEALRELLYTCDKVTILPRQKVTSVLLDGGSAQIITVVTPLGENYRSARGTLIFMIKDSAYQSLMRDAIEGDDNTYIVYGEDVLASREPLSLPQGDVVKSASSGERVSTVKLNGESYLLLSVEGETRGMRYISALPLSSADGAVWSALSRFLMIAALLLSLSLPIAFMLTRKNYAPILELRDSLVSGGEATGDAISDIQAGVQALVGQNMALSTRLDSSLPMRKSTFVMDFMKGRYQSRAEAIRAAEAVELSIDRKWMAVALSAASDKLVRPTDVGASPLGESGLIAGQGIDLIAYDQHLYLLFFDDAMALDAFARALLESGKTKSKGAAVAISSPHEDFPSAAKAYLEAATAFDNRLVMGDERVLRFTDISIDMTDIQPRARSYSDAITQALRAGNLDLLDQRIADLMRFLKRTSMSLFAFRLIYNDVINALLGMSHGVLDMDAARFYNVFTLSSCHSIDDLDNLLRTLCRNLAAPAQSDTDEQSAIRQVVDYIGEHFTDPDLSMTQVAERFGLSTAKLSMSFKELTQISPSDYLLMLRIEKAKELLSRTDMTIKDVSAAVGYYDSSGFIRRFKQYASITPLQYRQSLKQGD